MATKTTDQVITINDKGHKQTWNRRAWDMLKNKGTWKELPAEVIANTVTTKQQLPTGEANTAAQKITNSVDKKPGQKIKNQVNAELDSNAGKTTAGEANTDNTKTEDKQNAGPATGSGKSDEAKAAFLKEIDPLTRLAIKDFIDKINLTKTPKIEYAKNISNDDLKVLFAEALDYDADNFIALTAE